MKYTFQTLDLEIALQSSYFCWEEERSVHKTSHCNNILALNRVIDTAMQNMADWVDWNRKKREESNNVPSNESLRNKQLLWNQQDTLMNGPEKIANLMLICIIDPLREELLVLHGPMHSPTVPPSNTLNNQSKTDCMAEEYTMETTKKNQLVHNITPTVTVGLWISVNTCSITIVLEKEGKENETKGRSANKTGNNWIWIIYEITLFPTHQIQVLE